MFDTELTRQQIFWGKIVDTQEVRWHEVLKRLEEACDEIDNLRGQLADMEQEKEYL